MWRGFAGFWTEEVWVREDAGDGMVGGGDVERVDVRKDKFWLRSCSDHGWWLHHWLGRHFWRRYSRQLNRLLSNRFTRRWFPTELPIKRVVL